MNKKEMNTADEGTKEKKRRKKKTKLTDFSQIISLSFADATFGAHDLICGAMLNFSMRHFVEVVGFFFLNFQLFCVYYVFSFHFVFVAAFLCCKMKKKITLDLYYY